MGRLVSSVFGTAEAQTVLDQDLSFKMRTNPCFVSFLLTQNGSKLHTQFFCGFCTFSPADHSSQQKHHSLEVSDEIKQKPFSFPAVITAGEEPGLILLQTFLSCDVCGQGPGRRQLITSVGLTSRTGLTDLGVQQQLLVSFKEARHCVNGGSAGLRFIFIGTKRHLMLLNIWPLVGRLTQK